MHQINNLNPEMVKQFDVFQLISERNIEIVMNVQSTILYPTPPVCTRSIMFKFLLRLKSFYKFLVFMY